jgi:hypothetical protein
MSTSLQFALLLINNFLFVITWFGLLVFSGVMDMEACGCMYGRTKLVDALRSFIWKKSSKIICPALLVDYW